MKQPISILPAIALRGTTILPDMIVHFDVSRERSIKAIEAAMLHDQKIFLVTQKDPEVEKPELSELYHHLPHSLHTVSFVQFIPPIVPPAATFICYAPSVAIGSTRMPSPTARWRITSSASG